MAVDDHIRLHARQEYLGQMRQPDGRHRPGRQKPAVCSIRFGSFARTSASVW